MQTPAEWIEPHPWPVTGFTRESADVATVELSPPEPFTFLPGQFNMLYVDGVGEAPISICGDLVIVAGGIGLPPGRGAVRRRAGPVATTRQIARNGRSPGAASSLGVPSVK